MKNSKIKLATVLAMAFVCVFSAFMAMTMKPARAEDQANNFYMEEGASIRKTNRTGMRFSAYVSETYYNSLEAQKESNPYVFGMALAPADKVTSGNIDQNTPSVKLIDAEGFATSDVTGYKRYNVALVDIPEAAFTKEIIARAYVKIGDTYTFSTEQQKRDIAHVAASALNNGDNGTALDDIVNAVAKNVTIDKDTESMNVGETLTLQATTDPAGYDVVWSVTGDSVEVDDKGEVTAIKGGEATVTASFGEHSDSVTITVNRAAAKDGEIESFDDPSSTASLAHSWDGTKFEYVDEFKGETGVVRFENKGKYPEIWVKPRQATSHYSTANYKYIVVRAYVISTDSSHTPMFIKAKNDEVIRDYSNENIDKIEYSTWKDYVYSITDYSKLFVTGDHFDGAETLRVCYNHEGFNPETNANTDTVYIADIYATNEIPQKPLPTAPEGETLEIDYFDNADRNEEDCTNWGETSWLDSYNEATGVLKANCLSNYPVVYFRPKYDTAATTKYKYVVIRAYFEVTAEGTVTNKNTYLSVYKGTQKVDVTGGEFVDKQWKNYVFDVNEYTIFNVWSDNIAIKDGQARMAFGFNTKADVYIDSIYMTNTAPDTNA